ncbi:MAG TPA: chemotaxis protein CheW [Methylomirabilota bacterium]|jgi:purine-binding chemotaxis protein CheW|nr:chemotaxis protein CheW [Methylomirabilota bacterium]
MPGKSADTREGTTSVMQTANYLLVFLLDAQPYALRLSAVERVLRAVAVTPLPRAPEIVVGIVNVQGRPLPVVDLRRRLGLPRREIELSDRFIVARTMRFPVILIVDAVVNIIEYEPDTITFTKKILPKSVSVDGVACVNDSMIFIHNLDSFLSLEEERVIAKALPAV